MRHLPKTLNSQTGRLYCCIHSFPPCENPGHARRSLLSPDVQEGSPPALLDSDEGKLASYWAFVSAPDFRTFLISILTLTNSGTWVNAQCTAKALNPSWSDASPSVKASRLGRQTVVPLLDHHPPSGPPDRFPTARIAVSQHTGGYTVRTLRRWSPWNGGSRMSGIG